MFSKHPKPWSVSAKSEAKNVIKSTTRCWLFIFIILTFFELRAQIVCASCFFRAILPVSVKNFFREILFLVIILLKLFSGRNLFEYLIIDEELFAILANGHKIIQLQLFDIYICNRVFVFLHFEIIFLKKCFNFFELTKLFFPSVNYLFRMLVLRQVLF